MRLRTVDAFTDRPFTGNPAAVALLDKMPPDEWMAAVARETNVSDTAFVIREKVADADFRLRWFTPAVEVDLCGHATLASAHCLFEEGVAGPIRFATRSGVLTVSQREDGSLAMDFPFPRSGLGFGNGNRRPCQGLPVGRSSLVWSLAGCLRP
ncbi:PhzF family phenazine biosynthesis protein [Gaiella sp.]|uniref:PhzF family phenazine biosynthesis protein n=1 Tax=Gaiella sp. TaxID=2663207 RepID=UPI003983951A